MPGKLPRWTLLVPCLRDPLVSIHSPTYQYSDTPSSLEVLSYAVQTLICLELNVTKGTQCPSVQSRSTVLSPKPVLQGDLEILVKMAPCHGLNLLGLRSESRQVMRLRYNFWEITGYHFFGQSYSLVNPISSVLLLV